MLKRRPLAVFLMSAGGAPFPDNALTQNHHRDVFQTLGSLVILNASPRNG